MDLFLILLVGYALPAVCSYFLIRNAFLTVWKGLTPGLQEIFMVFTPLLNIMASAALAGVLASSRFSDGAAKFFKIKQ